jgi:methanogenic corrinoid protein MtbC1
MSDDDIHVKILGINNSEAQQERIINELIQKMIDLELVSFELIIDEHIRVKGIEKTIHKIIFPFMERIGVLWVTGHVNPAQEHLVSNIIRQKLIVGTQAISNLIPTKKTVLLFLPEGEFHELGLLFIQFLLKNQGIGVLYLGTNIPLEDVDYVVENKAPDFIYTHLTSVSNLFNFDRFIQQSQKRFRSIPLIISGRLASIYDKPIPPNVHFKKSLQEVTTFVAELA